MARLETLAASKSFHVFCSRLEAQERNLRSSMTTEQLRAYRTHLGEIGDCPACGSDGVEIKYDEHPDIIGWTTSVTYPCCGHTAVWNSACEYNEYGDVVDVR